MLNPVLKISVKAEVLANKTKFPYLIAMMLEMEPMITKAKPAIHHLF